MYFERERVRHLYIIPYFLKPVGEMQKKAKAGSLGTTSEHNLKKNIFTHSTMSDFIGLLRQGYFSISLKDDRFFWAYALK